MLVLTTKPQERIYVFDKTGKYLKLSSLDARTRIGFEDSEHNYKILRQEVIESMGGLERVAQQIRDGKFKLNENRSDEKC